jgi:hypothetical protein
MAQEEGFKTADVTLEYMSVVNKLFIETFFRRDLAIVSDEADIPLDKDNARSISQHRQLLEESFEFFYNWKEWVEKNV